MMADDCARGRAESCDCARQKERQADGNGHRRPAREREWLTLHATVECGLGLEEREREREKTVRENLGKENELGLRGKAHLAKKKKNSKDYFGLKCIP